MKVVLLSFCQNISTLTACGKLISTYFIKCTPRGKKPKCREEEWPLKVWMHFMHEHLPIGCQSHGSIVEIRNKLEINYLRRRGSSSHAARSGGKQTSWRWWIQPCKLVFLVGPLSFYNRSWCACKILCTPWGIWHKGWSDREWQACLVFYQSALSQPTSFLPLHQLTPWPASVLLLKYSNTNGFWQPAIMRNNRPRLPQPRWADLGGRC